MKSFLLKFLVACIAVGVGLGGLSFAQFIMSIDEAFYGWCVGVMGAIIAVAGVFPLFLDVVRFCGRTLRRTVSGIIASLRASRERRAAAQAAKESSPAKAYPVPDARGQQMAPGDAWFWIVDGAVQGPADTASLQSWILSGILDPETLLWKEGLPTWLPAKAIPEFATVFASPSRPSSDWERHTGPPC
ncbi:MAG: DUF4339 domain-containing protein [Candidatus Sumerlaeaceae bacterium]|nr:DUF4339 domain-containing protein [Candidatus Sumerlaeaceae bacterium]